MAYLHGVFLQRTASWPPCPVRAPPVPPISSCPLLLKACLSRPWEGPPNSILPAVLKVQVKSLSLYFVQQRQTLLSAGAQCFLSPWDLKFFPLKVLLQMQLFTISLLQLHCLSLSVTNTVQLYLLSGDIYFLKSHKTHDCSLTRKKNCNHFCNDKHLFRQ